MLPTGGKKDQPFSGPAANGKAMSEFFLHGTKVPGSKYHFNEILKWNFTKLEREHDYIQLLFPIPTASPHNPMAPVLDREAAQAFKTDPNLRAKLIEASERMFAFYGLTLNKNISTGAIRLSKKPGTTASAFDTRAAVWLTSGNHNFKRITRILLCLKLCGLEPYSDAFLQFLKTLNPTEKAVIGNSTFDYWTHAAKGEYADPNGTAKRWVKAFS